MPVAAGTLWPVLTDASALAELTPLVSRIEANGDLWSWTLVGISALGITVAPTFTERMTFEPTSRILFEHEPAPGSAERAGAEGVYELAETDASTTRLSIDIAAWIELPIPSIAGHAVERVMATTMQLAGDRFARRLYQRLGIEPRVHV